MKYVIVDIEADGPVPSPYSMLSLGACTLEGDDTFYVEIQPLMGGGSVPETEAFLREHGLDRQKLKATGYPPRTAMEKFDQWLTDVAKGDKLRFVADNAGFDWMFVAWYLHRFTGRNQFGFSPLSLTSLYHGYIQDVRRASEYKRKYRTVQHSHNALDDAKGNAGAMKKLQELGIRF